MSAWRRGTNDAGLAATVSDVTSRIRAISGVSAVDVPAPGAMSSDGRALLVSVVLAGLDRPARDTTATAVADELHAIGPRLPRGATVSVGGAPVLSMQTHATVQEDLRRAEVVSLPLALLVLVVVFGGVIAAGVPVITAAVSVAAAMGVLLGFSTFTDVDQEGVTVVTLLGLGLSVDYGLLLIARDREELLHGWSSDIAIARAWQRPAGRSCSAH